MTNQEFNEAIDLLRSKDPMTFEEGFHWLIGFVDEYLDQITALMKDELNPDLRGKFIEVLGYSDDERVIPVLAAELNSQYRDVRFWAHSQLEYFENSKAIQIANKYKIEHPDEDWY